MGKLKIGLDAYPLCRLNGGIGYYIFYLLDELVKLKKEHQFILYAPSEVGDIEHFKSYANVKIRKVARCPLGHSFWSLFILPFLLWKDSVDVFWGTTQSLPLLKRRKMKTILSLYDFTFLLFPKTVSTFKCLYLKMFSSFFFKNADAIIPISKGTGNRLMEYYGIKYHSVVHPPIKLGFFIRKQEEVVPVIGVHGLQYKHYVVTVGSIEPRKNFPALIKTYIQIIQDCSLDDVLPLVIIGGGGWKNEEIRKILIEARERFPTHVIHLETVSDRDLPFYLAGANIYVTFSLYEGYGMPLAEARVCGTPIACFDLPEMREASEEDGIFLKDAEDHKVKELFLCRKEGLEAKRSQNLGYIPNDQSAKKIAQIIDSF